MNKDNIMERFEAKFLWAPDDPEIDRDDWNTIIIHIHDPLCVIRIIEDARRDLNWREPKGIVKRFEERTPAEEIDEEQDRIEKYTLWIFRPLVIPAGERDIYEQILEQAWRFYSGDDPQ